MWFSLRCEIVLHSFSGTCLSRSISLPLHFLAWPGLIVTPLVLLSVGTNVIIAAQLSSDVIQYSRFYVT